MKHCVVSLAFVMLLLTGCTAAPVADVAPPSTTPIAASEPLESAIIGESVQQPEPSESFDSQEQDDLVLTIGDTVLTAAMADNSSAQALRELLADGPLTINMSDYGGMEKVGPIGHDLPRNDEQITAEAGDLILYQGNSFVMYYAPNTWNFTRLGKLNEITADSLKELLGDGGVTVILSLN